MMLKIGLRSAICMLALSGCNTARLPLQVQTTGNFFAASKPEEQVLNDTLKPSIHQFRSTPEEEALAQKILAQNQDGQFTVWDNSSVGELQMGPTQTLEQRGRTCRRFTVRYWFTGSFRVRQDAPGTACRDAQGRWVATTS